MNFSEALKIIRKRNEFGSAKAFYQYFEERAEISFNYSYYTRMEAGKVLPSSEVVNQMCHHLSEIDSELLVKSYCIEMFPAHEKFFGSLPKEETLKVEEPQAAKSGGQQTLSASQVEVLIKSRTHYQLFLLLTLAREPVSKDDLKKLFGKVPQSAIEDLVAVKIAYVDSEALGASVNEFRFPKASSTKLKAAYKTLDEWDEETADAWGFRDEKKKFFLRRTSPRHFDLIVGFLDQMDQLIRVADEIDSDLNNEVFVLQYQLKKSRLPG